MEGKMQIRYDDWQQEILDYKGDILLCKGRRIGGTEIFSIKAAERMVKQVGVKIVFVSLTEDQAKLCISVALEHLTRFYKGLIGRGKFKPQLGQIWVKHGKIYSSFQVRPVGNTGNAVRGFDGDILGVDEAPWQPQVMWRAARPIISTNDGEIWMWGTPDVDEGYFFEQWVKAYINKDPDARFKVWYKNTEEVLEERPVCESWTQKQKDGLRRILEEEEKDMTEVEYGNEYLGKFLSDMRRMFTKEWIEKVCTLPQPSDTHSEVGLPRPLLTGGDLYLGVDIAALGEDDSTFEGLRRVENNVSQFHHETTSKTLPTDTEQKIINLDKQYNFTKIGIDSGGMGIGVLAHLLDEDSTKFKVVGLDNSVNAPVDRDGKTVRNKVAMYANLIMMGERGEIKLFNSEEVKRSLRSIQSGENGKIGGRFSHITEGLIRAAWLAKTKHLNLWIRSIGYDRNTNIRSSS